MKSNDNLIFKKYAYKVISVCFWLLLWEIISRVIHQEVILASPVTVIVALLKLCRGLDFWRAILYSFTRIVSGFLLALVFGSLLAVLSYNFKILKELLSPLFNVIKATPVASFIILALFWINKRNLSVLISFLMVIPIVYINVEQGLRAADRKLLQMAKVFHISRVKKIKAIYIPSVLPHFISAVSVGLGFSWKSGIAAEVIGIPAGSIGERLYEAKLYLMTKELLAWTIVIIVISVLFEKAVMSFLRLFQLEKITKR